MIWSKEETLPREEIERIVNELFVKMKIIAVILGVC